MDPIRVMVVDEFLVARTTVTDVLPEEPGIQVVGTAADRTVVALAVGGPR